MAEKFSEYFSNRVKNLDIQFKYGDIISNTADTDPVLKAISKYFMHPSILKINEFSCHEYKNTTYDVWNSPLSGKISWPKVSPNNSIPVKIIKENDVIFTNKILNDFNSAVIWAFFLIILNWQISYRNLKLVTEPT